MVTPRNELRDELLAVTAAREELSPHEETYLVESFLDRLDEEIDARVDSRIDARLKARPRSNRGMEAWVVPATLALTIPIAAVAAQGAGQWGLLIALAFVLVVLLIYSEQSRH